MLLGRELSGFFIHSYIHSLKFAVLLLHWWSAICAYEVTQLIDIHLLGLSEHLKQEVRQLLGDHLVFGGLESFVLTVQAPLADDAP
jgi:hypothetical protein